MRPFIIFLPLLAACTDAASKNAGPSPGSDSVDSADSGVAEVCGPSAEQGLEPGQCALDFTLPDAAGQPFTLSDQRGKVALVDISAVW